MDKKVSETTEIKASVESALVDCLYRIYKVNANTGEFEVYRDNGFFVDDELQNIPDIYAFMQKLITDKIIFPEYTTICRRFTNPEYVRKSVFSREKRIVQSYKTRTTKGIQWVTFTIMVGHDCGTENPSVLFTWREADSDAMTLLDTLPTISSLYDKHVEKIVESGIVQFTYQKTNGKWINIRILENEKRQNAKPETIWIFSEETN